MVTALATCFHVATNRNGSAMRHLLGSAYGGIVGSDRHRPYMALPPERHQLCWSHLVRDFQKILEILRRFLVGSVLRAIEARSLSP